MSPKLKVLIYTAIGLLAAFGVMCAGGLFSAEGTKDALRIVCDGFFVVGAMLLFGGGLVWCYNGGAMDGLGYSAKILINRIRPKYETEHRESFAQYREKREAKASSPVTLVFSGLNLLLIAVIVFLVYSNLA